MSVSSVPNIPVMVPSRSELVGLVEQIWVLESSQVLTQRVYGTGKPQLLLHAGVPFIEGLAGPRERRQSHVYLSGQVTRCCDVTAPPGARTIGVVLHPAALRAFVDVPAAHVTDGQACPTDLGPCIRGLLSLPLPEMSMHDCLSSIESWLVRGIRRDVRIATARHLVGLVLQRHSVPDLLDETGWSERKLQRFFAEFVGISPRELLSVARLELALELLRTQPAASAAAGAGYFDQPHFIKACKSHTGYTPAEYARECWGRASTTSAPSVHAPG